MNKKNKILLKGKKLSSLFLFTIISFLFITFCNAQLGLDSWIHPNQNNYLRFNFQIEHWGNVDWAHNLELHDTLSRVAAAELFKLDWSNFLRPSEEVLRRYQNIYGRFNYVLPEENKRLVKYQKGANFVSPEDSYQKANILLRKLSDEQLNEIRKGDRQLAELAISNQINS